jgi:hypothetical protein
VSKDTGPTPAQRETLLAIERGEKGSWESIAISDLEECTKEGWIEPSGKQHRLTAEGREILRASRERGGVR